jgi:hypothetical protein
MGGGGGAATTGGGGGSYTGGGATEATGGGAITTGGAMYAGAGGAYTGGGASTTESDRTSMDVLHGSARPKRRKNWPRVIATEPPACLEHAQAGADRPTAPDTATI